MSVRRSLLVLLALTGCKSADKGGPLGLGVFGSKDATPASRQAAAADPLLTNGRIPPQDLPVPGKDGLASKGGGRDPLLGRPADRDDRPERTAGNRRVPPKPNDTSSLPPASVPYRPSLATTPAALAGRIDPAAPDYRLGDDPPPVASIGRGDRTAEELTAELKKLGATVGRPTLEGGRYVVRGEVEPDPDGRPGARRAYEATGATPAAAVRDLLGQMRDDVKR